jgi:hypothetical protein
MRYLLSLFLLILVSVSTYGQITITQFNADWNKSNNVDWLDKLSDVDKIKYIDIAENTDAQDKHEIVVVPTIIIFKEGEEVKRFQADISFAMKATKEELQEFIDELLMQDF